ncbi:hypothetical protein HWV62_39309 [Athelia sp. TMB]|nr:hypothetical protein HWV62_39309 [Athelia sp. TMB]
MNADFERLSAVLRPYDARLTAPWEYETLALDRWEIDSANTFCKVYATYRQTANDFLSGYHIAVCYRKNLAFPDALENILIRHPDPRVEGGLFNHIQPLLDLAESNGRLVHPVNQLTFATLNGKFDIVDIRDDGPLYPSFPADLQHLPVVPLADLQRKSSVSTSGELVTWQDRLFVFNTARDQQTAGFLLTQIRILDKLASSPNVISIVGVVIHRHKVRGFLTPHLLNGSLFDLYEHLREVRHENKDIDGHVSWNLKMVWAKDMAKSIAAIHKFSFFNGNLGPYKFVVDDCGHLLLAGVRPLYCIPANGANCLEEMGETVIKDSPTAADDIFELGFLLWGLVEGTWADYSSRRLHLLKDKVPPWFHELVQQFITRDPGSRPTAIQVLQVIEQQHNSKCVL